ncbi:hypothetical protein JOD54_000614 [Actinokineospora baliensis]|nr:hypothetical protein [Actinokineospora baliensis]MBM7770410.1 hypothetical protein [Actinokineospora baliensis]
MTVIARPEKPKTPVFQSTVVVEQPQEVPTPRVSVENPVFSSATR